MFIVLTFKSLYNILEICCRIEHLKLALAIQASLVSFRYRNIFLSHRLIAGCDIGVQLSVCSFVRQQFASCKIHKCLSLYL